MIPTPFDFRELKQGLRNPLNPGNGGKTLPYKTGSGPKSLLR